MCGRYSLAENVSAVQQRLGASQVQARGLTRRYNITPTGQQLALMSDAPTLLRTARWGMRLNLGSDLPGGKAAHLVGSMVGTAASTVTGKVHDPVFNARTEKITGPVWKPLIQQRALVPATSWFEFSGTGSTKSAWVLFPDDQRIFCFAGLWKTTKDGQRQFTLLTTQAAEGIAHIHPRMPVVLPPGAEASWLDPQTPAAEARALLQPYPSRALRHHRVNPRVGDARVESAELLAPYTPPPTLF